MPNLISCPACGRQLNVPDDLLEKPVQCPACGLIFKWTPGQAEAEQPPVTPAAPPVPFEDRPRRPASWEDQDDEGLGEGYDDEPGMSSGRRKPRSAAVTAPAVALLVLGVFSLLIQGYFLLSTLVTTPAQMEAQMNLQQPNATAQDRELQQKVIEVMLGRPLIIFHAVSMAVSLIEILGGIMMLTGRMRWLAILASVLAMVNVDCCCVVPGLPIGLWSLLVLSRPAVRSTFR